MKTSQFNVTSANRFRFGIKDSASQLSPKPKSNCQSELRDCTKKGKKKLVVECLFVLLMLYYIILYYLFDCI